MKPGACSGSDIGSVPMLPPVVRTLPAPDHPLAVPCTVFPPVAKPGQKTGLVVHLYGHGGSLTLHCMMMPSFSLLLQRLCEKGYWVIVPDLGPSHFMNAQAVARLDAIIAGMMEKDGVDPDRIHLLGGSMGGASALIYASRRQKTVRSICALFPITDLAAWTAERPGWLPPVMQAHGLDAASTAASLHDLSPINHIGTFVGIPVLLVHGDADGVVPVHHSRDFHSALRAAGGESVYHEVPGGGHDDAIVGDLQDRLLDFIVRQDGQRSGK